MMVGSCTSFSLAIPGQNVALEIEHHPQLILVFMMFPANDHLCGKKIAAQPDFFVGEYQTKTAPLSMPPDP
jgi:hypothetical protein